MDIFELLDFNFGDFIKTPAFYCIALGCVLLIVGIVLNLKENKKLKNATAGEEPKVDTPEATTEAAATEEAAPAETPVVVPTEGDGVKEVETTPVAETINFSDVASVESLEDAPKVEAVPEVKLESLDTPAVEPVVAPAPVIDTSTVVESLDAEPTEPVAYGGASPEVTTEAVVEEKPREIYGGANPLENTAPIPTETVHEAYAGAQVTPVEAAPAVEPVAPATEAPVAEVTPVEVAPATEAPVAEVTPVVEAPTTEAPTEEVEKLEF